MQIKPQGRNLHQATTRRTIANVGEDWRQRDVHSWMVEGGLVQPFSRATGHCLVIVSVYMPQCPRSLIPRTNLMEMCVQVHKKTQTRLFFTTFLVVVWVWGQGGGRDRPVSITGKVWT